MTSKYPIHELLRIANIENVCINREIAGVFETYETTINVSDLVAEFKSMQAQLAAYEKHCEIIHDDYKPQFNDVIHRECFGCEYYKVKYFNNGEPIATSFDDDEEEINLVGGEVIRLANGKFAIKQSEMGE